MYGLNHSMCVRLMFISVHPYMSNRQYYEWAFVGGIMIVVLGWEYELCVVCCFYLLL